MNIINSFSSVRFTLNGVQYLRNYISAVYGNDIEVFNCYERKDVLIPRTHYSQFMVNGTPYYSATSLQAALISVIYSRNTLGSGAVDQDNIDIKFYFKYTSGNTLSQILTKINQLPFYNVNERQSVWFIGHTTSMLQSGNRVRPLSGISAVKYKMLNKGTGSYGTGGTQLVANDIELVYHNHANTADIAGDPATHFIAVDAANLEIYDWLNTRNEPLIIRPWQEGFTLFQGPVSQRERAYVFTGTAGRYGVNALQATREDFTEVNDVIPAAVPSLRDILETSGNLSIPLVIEDTATGTKTSYTGLGKTYTSGTGKVVSTMYQEPTENVKYTIPAKKANDTFAMMSDIRVQGIKYIDTEVTNNVYTITGTDFGRILIYSGNTNITILLSTNAQYETGSNLNFIQAGAGAITFATDGFIIKHALDEQPVTYGANAIAGITVIDEFVVLLFGKLKPAS